MLLYQKVFAGVINLLIWGWGVCSRSFKWVQCNHQGSKGKEGGRRVRCREGDVMTEAEVGVKWTLEAEKGNRWIDSPIESPEETQPCQYFA